MRNLKGLPPPIGRDRRREAASYDVLKHGSRIFSAYLTNGRKIYVITEADRSMTTLLFGS